jgi:hypothetical protein
MPYSNHYIWTSALLASRSVYGLLGEHYCKVKGEPITSIVARREHLVERPAVFRVELGVLGEPRQNKPAYLPDWEGRLRPVRCQ